MGLEFEWDGAKASSNRRKHHVGFEEASTAFADPCSLSIPDPVHSEDEDRWILLGASASGRLLVVVHVERDGIIRIISARRATARERRQYEE